MRFEAENLDEMLGRPRFEAPPDLCRYVAELKQTLAALRGVVVEVNGAKCEVAKARWEKHAAMADHDRIFLHAARLFEDLCRPGAIHFAAVAADALAADATSPDATSPPQPSTSPPQLAAAAIHFGPARPGHRPRGRPGGLGEDEEVGTGGRVGSGPDSRRCRRVAAPGTI